MEQEKVLSYGLLQVQKKNTSWLSEERVEIWEGKVKEAVFLVVMNIEESQFGNPMQTLTMTIQDKNKKDVNFQVPSPRIVTLRLAIVPAFKNPLKALDLSALIKRNIHDDGQISLNKYNWHGNGEMGTIMEFQSTHGSHGLPDELDVYNPYRWDICLQLGINSSREEKITRVKKRQISAVHK